MTKTKGQLKRNNKKNNKKDKLKAYLKDIKQQQNIKSRQISKIVAKLVLL